ncbi:hypothetical protein [Paenibacillus tianjinensis]|uniref:Uncharacterized protein n=1 Tax=Paenibacillus tianjinensis TaxID=2810347 RepID=A0ABX7L9Z5_9BACL|nr:hypothetical protein [Paenibacillus tianjinensis]QSF43558.1 hypothetical protein JRJ22_20060 [Paenibacillus tianjinensis]
MPDLITQLQYNDANISLLRKGTDDDPYVDRTDLLPVINGLITLFELPSRAHHVQIPSLIEIDQEIYSNRQFLEENEFLVNYSVGAIQFHPSKEGMSFLCNYKGRGLTMIAASRVYAMIHRNPDVVTTLQDYIDQIQDRINENKLVIENVEDLMNQTKLVIDNAILATDNANIATQDAQSAAALAQSAYNTTRLVFKEPVAEFTNIPSTYPSPLVGWTVQTYKDGKRYRFDGSRWIEIDVFGSNLQVVNEFKDGLMSIADYQKLKTFPVDIKERVISFSLPDAVQGAIENFIPFPFDGEITDLSAYCATAGETVSTLSLERTRDMKNWTELTDRRLQFEPNHNFDDKNVTFTDAVVQKGDIFRINLTQQGLGLYNLTVSLKIKI